MSFSFNTFLLASIFTLSTGSLFAAAPQPNLQPNRGVIVINNQAQPNGVQANQLDWISQLTVVKGAKGLAWLSLAAALGYYGAYPAGVQAYNAGSFCYTNYSAFNGTDSVKNYALTGAGGCALITGAGTLLAANLAVVCGQKSYNHLSEAVQNVYGVVATGARATGRAIGWLFSPTGLTALALTAAVVVPAYAYKVCRQ